MQPAGSWRRFFAWCFRVRHVVRRISGYQAIAASRLLPRVYVATNVSQSPVHVVDTDTMQFAQTIALATTPNDIVVDEHETAYFGLGVENAVSAVPEAFV